ncbi:MAG: DUF5765 domain-containing protein [Gammaproteobacteria bacterium]
MCFNPMITWATAGLGLATFILVKAKKKPATLYLPPLYFGFMEMLQGIMYTQINSDSLFLVNFLVYFAYLHVCFQPLVVNYWLGYFIRPDQKKIYDFTLKLCFIGGLFLLSRVFVTGDAPLCNSFETLCSAKPEVFYGSHHIAWSLPLVAAGWKYFTPSIALHMFLFFIPGILFGFYRLMLLFFIFGPLLAAYITSNASEQSSIWCVIGLWWLVLTIFTAIYYPPRWLFPNRKI